MKHIIEQYPSGTVSASKLPDWLLAHGLGAVNTEEAAHLMGVPPHYVRQKLAAQRKRGAVISPARGLWVPVAAERRLWGAPEPMAYLDAMMEHLGAGYCVGWLSAAALHGASHHAAQVFQVATNKPVANRIVGRAQLQFFTREKLHRLSKKRKTVLAGSASVATIDTTMLMVADDIALAGGLDNAANVVIELAEADAFRIEDVVHSASCFSVTAARRLGWLLEEFTNCDGLDDLAAYCAQRDSSISMLFPGAERRGPISKRWQLMINRKVDPDL